MRKGQAACPECGSCEETGWSDAATEGFADGGYDEDDEFDYDEFVEREFPGQAQPLTAMQRFTKFAILLVCLALILTCFRDKRRNASDHHEKTEDVPISRRTADC